VALKALAGGSLFADSYGTGAPHVLALHGWGRNRADFQRVLEGLDGLALDLPGFGASPPPEHPIGTAGYADLLQPVLAEFATPPVVVGHSFGGRVAVTLAARSPVSALVLTGVPLLGWATRKNPRLVFRMLRAAHRIGVISEQRMEAIRGRYGSLDYRAATGVMRGVLVRVVAESYTDLLAGLDVPIHLVWGGDDREVPVTVAEQALPLLRHGRLTVVPGTGHLLPVEAPDQIRRAVLGLLP